MKKVRLDRRNIEIAYDDVGSGDVLLLLHAFPLDRQMWQPQLDGLADSYRLIAPDYPDFGESSAMTEGFTIPALADLMADFLDAAGIIGNVVVCGLSLGGYVALAMARQQPQRLRALILADTKAEDDDETAKAGREGLCTLAREKGAAGIAERLLPKLLGKKPNRAISDTVRAMVIRQSPVSIVAALMALRDRPDAVGSLAQIQVPTLILVGEDDAITPVSVAQSMADRILGSNLIVIPGAGHLANLEAPDAFNNAIRDFVRLPRST